MAILGRPADASGRFGNKGFEADHVEGRDEPPERLGEWVHFLAKPRKQGALDMAPAGFHSVERIVGHACRYESGYLNQDNTGEISEGKQNIFKTTNLKIVGSILNTSPRFHRRSK
jgi:hypothetical protein